MAQQLSNDEIRFFCIILFPLARSDGNSLREAEIIDFAERSRWLSQYERGHVRSRADSRFANRVHNVVSHRDSPRNPIRMGLVVWNQFDASFSLTPIARKFLHSVGVNLGAKEENLFDAISSWLTQHSLRDH